MIYSQFLKNLIKNESFINNLNNLVQKVIIKNSYLRNLNSILIQNQKLRFNYGISERQLITYVREARRRKGSTGEILLQLLEMRFDNIVFRLGFAPTIAGARQLISHGHFLVNGRKINIPSYLCKVNDSISVATSAAKIVKTSVERFANNQIPSHLEVNTDKLTANIKNVIPRDLVALQINELLVVEYYSRKV